MPKKKKRKKIDYEVLYRQKLREIKLLKAEIERLERLVNSLAR